MDRSDIAKFVAMVASFLGLLNVTVTPEHQELLVAIGLAVVTIIPLAYAMLKKDPNTGAQIPDIKVHPAAPEPPAVPPT